MRSWFCEVGARPGRGSYLSFALEQDQIAANSRVVMDLQAESGSVQVVRPVVWERFRSLRVCIAHAMNTDSVGAERAEILLLRFCWWPYSEPECCYCRSHSALCLDSSPSYSKRATA